MYFSRLTLDIQNPSVRQALSNCQDMHRNIMKAFSKQRRDVKMLYRVTEKQQSVEIYVYSAELPDWQAVAANGYLFGEMKDISGLPDKYHDGTVFRFDLLACPSKKVADPEKKNSRRVPLSGIEERMKWLTRQAEKYGFEIIDAGIQNADKRISGNKGQGTFSMEAVSFTGILKITDEHLFWQAYQDGIGPEKAYGMGLLLLSRT